MTTIRNMRDVREKTTEELVALVAQLRASVREHRFGVTFQQERNVAQRRTLRRTVARILTELTGRGVHNA